MQITNPEQLQMLSRNDIVHATFSDINGDVVESNGRVDDVNEVSIRIIEDDSGLTKEFELWRMLSLVCIERDVSFIREGTILSDLEYVARALDSRINPDSRRSKNKKTPHRK